jgi:large subunit ribosomal protein L21
MCPTMPTITTEKKVIKTRSSKIAKKVEPAQRNGSLAVIETGGKQYLVEPDQLIKIEKIKGNYKVGDEVIFDKVLLLNDNIGTPYVSGAKVQGKITEIGRNRKVVIIHFKQKSRYFKKAGHRQPYFQVVVEQIS